jgi:hypothetical protein
VLPLATSCYTNETLQALVQTRWDIIEVNSNLVETLYCI